jgi:hypothetical protein
MASPVAVFLSFFTLATGVAAAQAAVDVRLHPGGVDLRPDVAYERAVLTLSTPDGRTFEESFTADRLPGVELAGKGVMDGVYTWRLEVFTGQGVARTSESAGDALRPSSWIATGSFVVAGNAVLPAATESDAGSPDPGPTSDQPEDQVIPDDLIVQASACVGFDCVNGESFGFDTIRLKENNLRIKFDDTSASAGFPANDWQLTANDSASGGANKFSIEDVTGARVPFTVRAGAPTDSLFIDSSGRVGFGTSTPALRVHEVAADTPSFRFEQNGTGGFTPQTWDVAGNEANFFVRDVTGGSRLPFRIQPGAPTNSIYIGSTGNVGLGLTGPSTKLHVKATDGSSRIRVEEGNATAANRVLAQFVNNGPSTLELTNTATNETWRVINRDDIFVLNYNSDGQADNELALDEVGNLTILGALTTGSDRNRKRDIAPVDSGNVLERVLALPLATWRFRADALGGRHLGPMAQDFAALFGLGSDDKTIAPLDVAGVGLAAIQALHAELERRDQELLALRESNLELARRLAEIERAVARLAGR